MVCLMVQVNHFGRNVIYDTVLRGKTYWYKILIPRMNLVLSDSGLPFRFKGGSFVRQMTSRRGLN